MQVSQALAGAKVGKDSNLVIIMMKMCVCAYTSTKKSKSTHLSKCTYLDFLPALNKCPTHVKLLKLISVSPHKAACHGLILVNTVHQVTL